MATLIRADGTSAVVHPKGGSGFTLEELQAHVGGYIEFVTIGGTPTHRDTLVVHDEGRLLGFPLNPLATRLYRGTPPRHDGIIVGDVLRVIVAWPGRDNERIT